MKAISRLLLIIILGLSIGFLIKNCVGDKPKSHVISVKEIDVKELENKKLHREIDSVRKLVDSLKENRETKIVYLKSYHDRYLIKSVTDTVPDSVNFLNCMGENEDLWDAITEDSTIIAEQDFVIKGQEKVIANDSVIIKELKSLYADANKKLAKEVRAKSRWRTSTMVLGVLTLINFIIK